MRKQKIKIDTERVWTLHLESDNESDCLELVEAHLDSDGYGSRVVIPAESIDALITALHRLKKGLPND